MSISGTRLRPFGTSSLSDSGPGHGRLRLSLSLSQVDSPRTLFRLPGGRAKRSGRADMLQLESANTQVGAQAESKEQAIRMVADLLVRSGFIEPGYAESMLAREQVANTYLGKGVAIPHGLPKDREMIRRTGIAVLQVPGGVAWQPGETAKIIVGIAARSDEHLDILSNLTGLLYDDEMVARLAVTPDPQEVIAALSARRVDSPLSEPGEPIEA